MQAGEAMAVRAPGPDAEMLLHGLPQSLSGAERVQSYVFFFKSTTYSSPFFAT
ncbi:hypothetical protein EVA_16525 [gut metagenome]|uniref:Uncharacterized protein n=1 Tax=gut metagenome TaxID=749906 RepID=J9FLQ3_9ZZZZ